MFYVFVKNKENIFVPISVPFQRVMTLLMHPPISVYLYLTYILTYNYLTDNRRKLIV